MTILNMTATFGGLENRTLTLERGLNVLELPNEGGKSTWCAFLRGMLYGVETRKGRETSEKNRYTPWSGARMSGSMDILWQGKKITLRRFPKGTSPFGGFQAVYTGTEEPVPGLTADNVGQTLLGFGREVFERTCFIGQGGVAFGPSAELEQRLQALVSSGEEDVSYSATEATLRAWRNALQSNRVTGSIPRLQEQRDALHVRLQRLSALEDSLRETGGREEELARRQQAAQDALTDFSTRQERQYRLAYSAAHKKLADATLQAQEDRILHTPRLSFFPPLYRLSCLLAAFGLLLGFGTTLWLGLPFLTAAAALAGYYFVKRRRRRQVQETAVAEAQAELDALERWEPPREEQDRLQAELDAATRELLTLRTRLAQADGELRAGGDPEELRRQLELLESQLAVQQGQYAALTEAMDALATANAALQQRFAPAVSALAGEIMAKLTGGRYDSLTFTRSFEALAAAGDGQSHAAKLLSQGTADQAYLALRLAICLLALPEDCGAPIILDDALVTFDDCRLSFALQVLQDFAAQRQVLLFTCQGREAAALAAPPLASRGVL